MPSISLHFLYQFCVHCCMWTGCYLLSTPFFLLPCLLLSSTNIISVNLFYRFLRGDQYAIALGLLDEGEVTLGVLGCPNLPCTSVSISVKPSIDKIGCIFSATKGAGASMQSLDGSIQPKRVHNFSTYQLNIMKDYFLCIVLNTVENCKIWTTIAWSIY